MSKTERERQKLMLYRKWWDTRNELTVNKFEVASKAGRRSIFKRITKSDRFKQMFGETLQEYHIQLKMSKE